MTGETTDFTDEIAALELSLGTSAQMTAAFDAALARMRDNLATTGREVDMLGPRLGRGLRRAFDGLVFDGASLSETLRRAAQSMIDSVYSVAMRPVQNAVGGALAEGIRGLVDGAMPFAAGGAFTQGRVMPFARGGVVAGPTGFAMRGGGLGLMGEAGPEAILPLARGADGRLGVRSDGAAARPVTVVMNITTPDAQSFARSRSQIAAEMGRALAAGRRNR